MELEVGMKAPDFTLPRDGGGTVRLSDFLGRKVVLFFYPQDRTPGCTIEVCAFRDNQDKFDQNNTVIIGISRDSVASHDDFKHKHDLHFILASDPDEKVCEAYGVLNKHPFMGLHVLELERSTFLIDEEGFIEKKWMNVFALGHVKRVMRELHI